MDAFLDFKLHGGTVKDHLILNAALLVGLAVVDRLVIAPFVGARIAGDAKGARDRKAARWFFIHSFANVVVVASALGSVLSILDRPFDIMDTAVHTDASFFGSASRWPLTIVNSVHLYHMVGGFSLSSADYFHHLMFIPTLGLSGQVFSWGAGANWQAFYISGLPGGIDYFLLGLIKVKMLEPMKEKRINANLNTWLRAPGILMTTILLFASLRAGVHLKPGQAPTSAPVWAIVMQLILPPYNALYYGKQAVANYAVHYMLHLLGEDDLIKKRIEERTSVTTGTQILAWKDALAVPQRGS